MSDWSQSSRRVRQIHGQPGLPVPRVLQRLRQPAPRQQVGPRARLPASGEEPLATGALRSRLCASFAPPLSLRIRIVFSFAYSAPISDSAAAYD